MHKESLDRKWLSGELTEDELLKFRSTEDFELNNKILDGAKHFRASQFSKVKSFDELKPKLSGKETPVIKLKFYKAFYRIAAVLVISLAVYFTFFYNNTTSVRTLAAQKTTFELPDASTVTLNASSTAEFSKTKWAEKRELTLDGEAFFIVAKGSKFDVLTADGVVSVLGTQFNVKSRDNYFEVECFEGIVSVSSKGKDYKLTKGNAYRLFNGNEQLSVIEDAAPNWINNVSTFRSVPLKVVLEEFERQYKVSIIVDKVNTDRLFTGGFVHSNINQALNSITIPFNLEYNKNLNQITLYNRE